MIKYGTISITETSSPTEPVTLDQVKTWGRIDISDDDDILETMITGARQDIEGETGVKLVPHDVIMYVGASYGDFIQLPYGTPATVGVKMVAADGEETDAETDDFKLQLDQVMIKSNEGSFRLAYTVGTNVPQALKEAIMMLVVYRYNNRGDQEKQMGLPADIERKIQKYVQVWL